MSQPVCLSVCLSTDLQGREQSVRSWTRKRAALVCCQTDIEFQFFARKQLSDAGLNLTHEVSKADDDDAGLRLVLTMLFRRDLRIPP